MKQWTTQSRTPALMGPCSNDCGCNAVCCNSLNTLEVRSLSVSPALCMGTSQPQDPLWGPPLRGLVNGHACVAGFFNLATGPSNGRCTSSSSTEPVTKVSGTMLQTCENYNRNQSSRDLSATEMHNNPCKQACSARVQVGEWAGGPQWVEQDATPLLSSVPCLSCLKLIIEFVKHVITLGED